MNLLLWMLHVTEQHYPVIGALRVGAEHANGWLTIESFSRLDPDFAGAIHIWRAFDAREAIYTDGLKFIRESWAADQ